MRRVVCSAFGDPRAMTVVDEPVRQPDAGEVLVEIAAAGVSFADGLIVRGLYQLKPPLPFTPGSSFAGTVVAVGSGVEDVAVGAHVAGAIPGFGAYATHVLASAAEVVPIPAGVDETLAAAAYESYGTLWFAVTRRVTIAPGEQVVVLGAGGAVGLAAVDVARSVGARVVAVASSAEKRAAAVAAGADEALDYADLKNAIRNATGGGADVAFDPVGGSAAEAALRALRPNGRFCVLGFASGEIPRLPANVVLLRNRSVIGVDWGDWVRDVASPEERRGLLSDVLTRLERGDFRPAPPTTVPLADAGAVLQQYAERSTTGRYVLVP